MIIRLCCVLRVFWPSHLRVSRPATWTIPPTGDASHEDEDDDASSRLIAEVCGHAGTGRSKWILVRQVTVNREGTTTLNGKSKAKTHIRTGGCDARFARQQQPRITRRNQKRQSETSLPPIPCLERIPRMQTKFAARGQHPVSTWFCNNKTEAVLERGLQRALTSMHLKSSQRDVVDVHVEVRVETDSNACSVRISRSIRLARGHLAVREAVLQARKCISKIRHVLKHMNARGNTPGVC